MTPIVRADDAAIERGAAVLRRGGLVGFPTETVYGLGADARSNLAVAALYNAKGRPRFNPLIAHVADLDGALREGRLSTDARRLAEALWPGPLTLVVPVSTNCRVSLLARAGLESVALRVPAHSTAQALVKATLGPVVAPSANRSGRISPTTAAHVHRDLDGRIDLILDAGACPLGVESTIVSCLGEPQLLRPGALPRDAIETILARPLAVYGDEADRPIAPGLLTSHYAPETLLRLDAIKVEEGEAVLDFGGRLAAWRFGRAYKDLSPAGDTGEAAAALFAALRALDDAGAVRIAAAPIPLTGLGEAIDDRLRRAAAPR